MGSDISLPRVFPQEAVVVDEEPHDFITYQDEFGDVLAQTEYTFDKAPIQRLQEVTGTHNGNEVTFTAGEDYELSDDSTAIVWLDGRRPDPGTTFFVTYRATSILGEYLLAHEAELDSVEDQLRDIERSKFVEYASGEQLDRLGQLFGELGQRRGRDDPQYRIYLKSIVKSFISRGTKSDIKTALGAANDVPLEDITINENFSENSYEVQVRAETPITTSLIEEVADIADPSGVTLSRTRFTTGDELLTADDSVDLSFGSKYFGGELLVTDNADSNRAATPDEQLFVQDSATVNKNTYQQTEITQIGDTATLQVNSVSWGNTWGDFDWAGSTDK